MPDLTIVGFTDTVLLWERYGTTGQGNLTVLPYVEIKARFVRRSGRALDPKGNTVGVDAQVAVGRDVPVGSLVWEGSESDLAVALGNAATVPMAPTSGILEVVTSNRAKDIKGRTTRRELGLKRYGDTLPRVVDV